MKMVIGIVHTDLCTSGLENTPHVFVLCKKFYHQLCMILTGVGPKPQLPGMRGKFPMSKASVLAHLSLMAES